jgi:hypothetical protein
MLRGPISLSKIQPSIQMLNTIKLVEMTHAEKASKLDVDEDTKRANIMIAIGVLSRNPPLIGRYASDFIVWYIYRIESAQGSALDENE